MDKVTKKNLIITVVITAVLLIGIMVSVYAWYADYKLKVDQSSVISQTDDVILTEKEREQNLSGFGTVTYTAKNMRDLDKTYTVYASVYNVIDSGINGNITLHDHVLITAVDGLDENGNPVLINAERVEIGKITLTAFDEKDFTLNYTLIFEPEQIYLQGDTVVIYLHVE